MIIKFIYFIFTFYLLLKLYFNNLLYCLDIISELFTFLLKIFFKKRVKIINYNLNIVDPNLIKYNKKIL